MLIKNFKLKNLLVLAIVFKCTLAAAASSDGSVALPAGSIKKMKRVVCGYIQERWQTGSLTRRKAFLSHNIAISQLQKQLRRAKGKKKITIKKQILELQRRKKKESPSCTKLPHPVPSAVAGLVLSQDSTTMAYDTARDVLKKAAGKASVRSGNGVKLGGDVSGSAALSGTTDKAAVGQMLFEAFRNRYGYPPITSGTLNYNLDITDSSIKGSIDGTSLIIDQKVVDVHADYNLHLVQGLWRGRVTGKVTVDGVENEIDTDYDAPILLSLEATAIDADGIERPGPLTAGNKARVKAMISSNAPPVWVNYEWIESSGANLLGGGNGLFYCTFGHCSATADKNQVREERKGLWSWYNDYKVNAAQPSGTYRWEMNFKNAADLSSREKETSLEVTGGQDAPPPVLHSVGLIADAGLTAGQGGTAKLEVVAYSQSRASWLTLSLDGPAGNVSGGGSGSTFTECSQFQATPSHPCYGLGTGYWYVYRDVTFSRWAPNGTYRFSSVSVKNEGNKTSDTWQGDVSFVISGNTTADIPQITGISYVTFTPGQDPLSGTPVNGSCVAASQASDPLGLAIIVTVQSNAPFSWLNYSLTGPAGSILGGGNGVYPEDLGGGLWRTVMQYPLQAPLYRPRGAYYWSGITVKNQGEKQSTVYPGSLSFTLADSCQ